MNNARTAYYEGMFVFPQSQTANLTEAVEHIRDLVARGEGEIIAMKKWDERRLAYPIEKHNRGLFLLTYFKAPTASLIGLERDCNLSEKIIRFLITRADHLTEEEMRAADATQELADEARMREEKAETPVAEAEPADAPAETPTPAETPEAGEEDAVAATTEVDNKD